MVAIRPADAEGFVAKPDPAKPVILLFGPDAGLVHERAESLIRSAVDDVADPFSLARIEADELAAHPARLAEEAQTIPMFGGRRAVWVRANSRYNIVPAVEALLSLPQVECRTVIEAGELRRGAALRNLCERAKQAAAIGCYPDGARDLARLIDDEVRAAGLGISSDARAMLLPLLGADRQASRNELRKLVLYAAGKKQIDIDDVAAVVANASALALDAAIDAAFAGRLPEVETEFAKLMAAGTSPNAVIGASLRQVSELHKLRLTVEDGADIAGAVRSKQPPIHFSRVASVEAALRTWSAERLADIMMQFGKVALAVRQQADLAEPIARRALMTVAMNARTIKPSPRLRG
jgi:DNA polymerase-3 subunit delta